MPTMKNSHKTHWSVDEIKMKKDPETYAIWKLEQRINWGLGKGKIKRAELIKYWNKIDIDVSKREALSLALK